MERSSLPLRPAQRPSVPPSVLYKVRPCRSTFRATPLPLYFLCTPLRAALRSLRRPFVPPIRPAQRPSAWRAGVTPPAVCRAPPATRRAPCAVRRLPCATRCALPRRAPCAAAAHRAPRVACRALPRRAPCAAGRLPRAVRHPPRTERCAPPPCAAAVRRAPPAACRSPCTTARRASAPNALITTVIRLAAPNAGRRGMNRHVAPRLPYRRGPARGRRADGSDRVSRGGRRRVRSRCCRRCG
ncbi:hypothetical protein DFR70_10749 [Nocardia tenerifensis]|uniref:Uncharacterized protein n=1 Tax=Nocardia tenerifensis TaxID=228006 RepID=A0A318K2E0_9NOCA|nr:hypothetical protein DFR70_10749 [Nocardia tenerifensis]